MTVRTSFGQTTEKTHRISAVCPSTFITAVTSSSAEYKLAPQRITVSRRWGPVRPPRIASSPARSESRSVVRGLSSSASKVGRSRFGASLPTAHEERREQRVRWPEEQAAAKHGGGSRAGARTVRYYHHSPVQLLRKLLGEHAVRVLARRGERIHGRPRDTCEREERAPLTPSRHRHAR
ncbi:hypothetical protein HPB48_005159 [Haemaphysalis longicornis]|uniref:Uncharacterized protein n=1 Tax=Haemaphysalis longicornis TaxID=44386 RepID=A0A9J6FGX6_HAELO|nr:hypothetical protein HPB48_005159 [Haemaphysalis longicornis]